MPQQARESSKPGQAMQRDITNKTAKGQKRKEQTLASHHPANRVCVPNKKRPNTTGLQTTTNNQCQRRPRADNKIYDFQPQKAAGTKTSNFHSAGLWQFQKVRKRTSCSDGRSAASSFGNVRPHQRHFHQQIGDSERYTYMPRRSKEHIWISLSTSTPPSVSLSIPFILDRAASLRVLLLRVGSCAK